MLTPKSLVMGGRAVVSAVAMTVVAMHESMMLINLANVHDPSVMKAADGYYYMYQTDASYGNARAYLQLLRKRIKH